MPFGTSLAFDMLQLGPFENAGPLFAPSYGVPSQSSVVLFFLKHPMLASLSPS